MKLAIVGRRNAGKSTLVNAMAGDERVIASEIAGTTRDAVDVRVEFGNHALTVIDTAGVRKRKSWSDAVEAYSNQRTARLDRPGGRGLPAGRRHPADQPGREAARPGGRRSVQAGRDHPEQVGPDQAGSGARGLPRVPRAGAARPRLRPDHPDVGDRVRRHRSRAADGDQPVRAGEPSRIDRTPQLGLQGDPRSPRPELEARHQGEDPLREPGRHPARRPSPSW